MFGNDGLQDLGEPKVFLERVWSRRDRGAGPDGQLRSWRVGAEEGQDVSATDGVWRGEDVLSWRQSRFGRLKKKREKRPKSMYKVWVAFQRRERPCRDEAS